MVGTGTRNVLTGLFCLTTIIVAAAQQRPAKTAATNVTRGAVGKRVADAQSAARVQPRTATTALIPRTAEGHPDLDGVWTYGTFTQLERSAQFADRPSITPAEADELRRRLFLAVQNTAGDRFMPSWGDQDRPFLTIDGRVLTSVIQDPPDGRIPELTPEAQRRFQSHKFEDLDSAQDAPLYERCIKSASWPPFLPGTVYPNLQIVQTPTHVALVQEDQYGARIVPTNGAPHTTPRLATWLGDSRGRWEGDTLVIDTMNFRDQYQQRIARAGFDSNLHLTERFTLIRDNLIRYDFRIDDPTVFVKPWGGVMMLRKTDAPIYEVACHEGNYALANMLRQARARDIAR